MHFNTQPVRDKIGWISPAAVREPAFAIINRLQHMDPAIQVTATAVALCALAEALGMDMRDLIYVAENTLRDCEGPYTTHIQAIREYAKHELLRRGE